MELCFNASMQCFELSFRTTSFVSSSLLIWICLHLISSTTGISASFIGPSHPEQSPLTKSNTVRRHALPNYDNNINRVNDINQIVDEGLNASDYIINVLEPQLYYAGTCKSSKPLRLHLLQLAMID